MPRHGLSDSFPPARAALSPPESGTKPIAFAQACTTKSTSISDPHSHPTIFIYTIIVPLVSEKFRVDAAKFIKLPQLSAIQSGKLRAVYEPNEPASLRLPRPEKILATNGLCRVSILATISNQASNKVYIKNPDASIGASLKLTFLNAEGRGWAMVPGGAPDIRVCENYLWEDGGGITNFTNIATIMKKYKSPLTEGLKATRLGESRGVPFPVFDPEAFTTEIVPRRPGQEERRSRWKSAEVDIPTCVTTAEQQLENANGGITHSDGECTQPGD
ncbi:hypothetical protein M378DRAFT_18254 [Amanita muscaria Koide BX008]|uniref:ATP-citrate synthase citrate-binding domain-containing protein n=1 Tax=Amanita muscaria (strain Koide BX008) TaxID=946122 RepID=A0A0C2RXR8_AMAMK|nr:hypothetical protein M378DRAFT_18254 [Amanita muscaria Koide BX008]